MYVCVHVPLYESFAYMHKDMYIKVFKILMMVILGTSVIVFFPNFSLFEFF